MERSTQRNTTMIRSTGAKSTALEKGYLVPASDHVTDSNVSGDIEMSESQSHRQIETTKNCCTLTDEAEAI